MATEGDWIYSDCLQFVDNLFLSLKTDEPLGTSLCRIFTQVIGKMMRYTNCSQGIHLLSNTIYGLDRQLAILEMHHLYVDQNAKDYLVVAIESRQAVKGSDSHDEGLPDYVPITEKEFHLATGIHKNLLDLLEKCPRCSHNIQDRERWRELFNRFDSQRQSLGLPLIDCQTETLLVIPLAGVSNNFPASNLGTIILWCNGDNGIQSTVNIRGERLIGVCSGYV
jgi:hypothetical protein